MVDTKINELVESKLYVTGIIKLKSFFQPTNLKERMNVTR